MKADSPEPQRCEGALSCQAAFIAKDLAVLAPDQAGGLEGCVPVVCLGPALPATPAAPCPGLPGWPCLSFPGLSV